MSLYSPQQKSTSCPKPSQVPPGMNYENINVGLRHVLTGSVMLAGILFAGWQAFSALQATDISLAAADTVMSARIVQVSDLANENADAIDKMVEAQNSTSRSLAVRETRQESIIRDVDEIKKDVKSLRGIAEQNYQETQRKVDKLIEILQRQGAQ